MQPKYMPSTRLVRRAGARCVAPARDRRAQSHINLHCRRCHTPSAAPLPGVGTGAGFVALATSYGAAVEFDNFTVRGAGRVMASAVRAPKQAKPWSRWLRRARSGARGSVKYVRGATSSGGGTIALRADPSLCLAAAPVTPRPSSTVSPPPLPLPLASLAQSTAQALWRSGTTGHANAVDISDDSKWPWHGARAKRVRWCRVGGSFGAGTGCSCKRLLAPPRPPPRHMSTSASARQK